ncbi:MAG: hypothetical protein QG622_249 [Actinomycetota bacterium]|nr:hypothetical protein [Actinomycetota bacterium]
MSHGDGMAPLSRNTDAGFDPELEGSSYQTAPITSLAIARWTWSAIGAVVGVMLGFLSSLGGGFQATATLQVVGDMNADDASSIGKTLEALASSDAVLRIAVVSLRSGGNRAAEYAAAGGKLPAQGPNKDETDAKDYLSAGLKALYTDGTKLVEINVTRAEGKGQIAGIEANAIANAVQTKIQQDADEHIKKLEADFDKAYGTRGGGALVTATDPEIDSVRKALGDRKAQLLFVDKQSVQVIPAVHAFPAGMSQTVSALMGAAGGAFLGALAAVAAGAGRHKPHSPRELMSLAPDLTVRTTVQAGELAGRVMETDRRSVAVLAMPDTRFAATQLGMAIAHHLRTHGATVALVDRVSEFSPNSSAEDRLWALRRDVRRNIPANFSADMLVVVCGADEEALSLIAGQSDLLVAVVAKQRRTLLADIRRTVDAVRISEPVVVLAR